MGRVTGRSLAASLVASLAIAGCASEATWVQEMPKGGTIAYVIRDEGDILVSPGRASAIKLMEGKCPQGFRIVHEGRVPRVSLAVDLAWKGQLKAGRTDSDRVEETLWAVQFACN
ncbi:hypothetical protein [Nitrospira sp. Kam-Ns4a]